MANVLISNLPTYSGNTTGVFVVMNDSTNTTTYKVTKETLIGASGTSGTSGTNGSSGTSGTSGTTGTSGTSGTSATSGTSGTTGTSGTSGTSATSGTSGTTGTSGTSATSGTSGTRGTSGTNGSSGTSGTTGTSGTSGTSVAVSGTNNTVPKFTSSTTIGNSQIFDNGTNVGIGTTTPTSKLQVNGNIIFGASHFIGDNAFNSLLIQSSAGENILLDAQDELFMQTNGTTRLIIKPTGSVGVGTTSPPYLLSVGTTSGGTVAITTNTQSGSNASPINTDLRFLGYNNGNLAMIRSWDAAGNTVAGQLTFWTNSDTNSFAERMRITSDGNVGINTTSPSERFQVNGNGLFQGSSTVTASVKIASGNQWSLNADQSGGGSPAFSASGFYLRNENTTTNVLGFTVGGAATFVSTVTATQGIFRNSGVPAIQVIRDLNVVAVGSAGQGIEFGALNGATPTAGAAIYGVLDNPATTGSLVFQTLSGGTLGNRLTITNTGAATFTSTVTNLSGLFVQAANNSDLPFVNFSNNGGAFNWGRVGGLLQGDGDGTLYFQTKLGGGLTEKMRITSTGNVGINQTNPNQKLEVSGAIRSGVGISNGATIAKAVGRTLYKVMVSSNYDAGGAVRGGEWNVLLSNEGDAVTNTTSIYNYNSQTATFSVSGGNLVINGLNAGNTICAVYTN